MNSYGSSPPLPITDAADEIVYYESSEPFRAAGEVKLGVGFADPGRVALFTAPPTTLTIRNFKINNAYLDTACMLLLKDGRKIPETAYLLPQYDYDHAQVLHSQLVELDKDTEYVIGCTRDHGYYHWLTQAVPTIDWAVRSRPHDNISLGLPGMNAFHMASVELLGHGDVPRLHLVPHHHFYFPRVSHSEFLTGSMPFGISRAAQSTFQRLRNAVDASRWPRAPIVYVARTDSMRRVALNEQELVDVLIAEEVCVVVPGNLSLAEQIALFKQADAVIGPHGAGLTNAVFCKPGAIVYELLPEHFLNPCFSRLVQATGLHYWADIFASHGEGDSQERNWVIDINVVMERLRSIRQRIAEDAPTRVALGGTSGAMQFLRQNAATIPEVGALETTRHDRGERTGKGLMSRLWRRRPDRR